MTYLPKLKIMRDGRTIRFHGTWYRGANTNFIPSKQDLMGDDAVTE